MIGTSTIEYFFIRACIVFLHNIAAASLLYCTLLLLQLLLQLFLSPGLHIYRAPVLIEIWFLAEVAFFTAIYVPQRHLLQRTAIHPKPLLREEREKLFHRCNANVRDPEKYLHKWHLGAKDENIKRDNVKEFLRWAFLNTGETRDEDEVEIDGYIRATEKILGRDLPPGRGNAKTLRLTLDKVEFLHRSLLWYFCIAVVDTIMYWTMDWNGFHLHGTSLDRFFALFPFRPLALLSPYKSPAEHLTYWHRPHSSKTKLPVLFVHGIGVGLYPYTNFLRDLNKADKTGGDDADIGIIALEIMPISSRITHPALKQDAMIREIREIVQSHGWTKFILVGHSYGSTICTHLLKSPLTEPFVGPVVLIDPVSFLLHLPDVAYNFMARPPVHANEYQLWYFGSKDPGVAHTLSRTFFWSENILWREDLGLDGENGKAGRDVTVSLSGRDLIVDTDAVKRYLVGPSLQGPIQNGQALRTPKASKAAPGPTIFNDNSGVCSGKTWTGHGLDVLYFEQLDHAQVFDSEKTRKHVTAAIKAYSAKGYNPDS